MGLSERRSKQRLVGSASTRNVAWTSDSTLPGQRLLAGMGWKAGQTIGPGSAPSLQQDSMAKDDAAQQVLKLKFKQDNKGIGVDRAILDAKREGGQAGGAVGMDPWARKGASDFGSLLERLNAANPTSSAAESGADEEEEPNTDKRKKKKSKSRSDEAEEQAGEPSKKKPKKDKKEKQKVEEKAAKESSPSEAETAVVVAAPNVLRGRLAHRAKYLRAKQQVALSSIANINEILGIATPSSSASGSPAPPVRMAAGPGGAQVPIMNRQLPVSEDEGYSKEEQEVQSEKKSKKTSKKDRKGKYKAIEGNEDEADAEVSDKSKKKEKKRKRSAEEQHEQISSAQASDADETEKKKKKQAKKERKGTSEAAPSAEAARTIDPSLDPAQSNLRVSSQGVFEYLSNRLILRKAAVQRAKKAEIEGGNVWSRVSKAATTAAATIGAA